MFPNSLTVEPLNGRACGSTSFHGTHFGKYYFLGLRERLRRTLHPVTRSPVTVSLEGELYPAHIIVVPLENQFQSTAGTCPSVFQEYVAQTALLLSHALAPAPVGVSSEL